MANRIQIRHGSNTPTAGQLLPWELGWSGNALYIGGINNTILDINITGNATTATSAGKLSNTSKIGDTNQPVYFTASGVPSTISYTIAKSVPSDAIFTDTWNALSISQAGYVTQAPNDTNKFLRGDASWAAVTATNVGLGNVSNNNNLNNSTGTKGDIIYWSANNTPAHLNNTSSATKKFLSITNQVPSWNTLTATDIPFLIQEESMDNNSIAAGSSDAFNKDITKTGYTPIGIIGLQLKNASTNGIGVTYVTTQFFYLDDNKMHWGGKNTGNSSANIKITMKILYLKN